jgi:hypothetical protein
VEARVKVEPGASERETKRLSFPPPRPVETPADEPEEAQRDDAPAPPSAVEVLATAVAAAPDPAPALPLQPPADAALPDAPPQPLMLLPPAPPESPLASASASAETGSAEGEPAEGALPAVHALRLGGGDPAANDEDQLPKSDG